MSKLELGFNEQTPLHRLFARVSEVSSLPRVAQRVLELTHDEDGRASELGDIIRYDPALTARILRRVNSSYYGLRSRVADLKTAIALLGFREIHSLAITVFVSRMFDKPSAHAFYSRERLWNHCVAVAVTSRLVSNTCGFAKPEEAYVAGLLHDVGFILLDQHLKKHLYQIVEKLTEHTPTSAIEQSILSFDHAQLGEFVTSEWNFPPQITNAIGYHHRPEEYTGEHRDLLYVVTLANYLCSRSGWTSLGIHNIPMPPQSVLAGIEVNDATLTMLLDELPDTLAKADVLANS